MAEDDVKSTAEVTAAYGDEDPGDLIDETVEVGHGGIPIFLAVCIILVLLWALVAWKPWSGY